MMYEAATLIAALILTLTLIFGAEALEAALIAAITARRAEAAATAAAHQAVNDAADLRAAEARAELRLARRAEATAAAAAETAQREARTARAGRDYYATALKRSSRPDTVAKNSRLLAQYEAAWQLSLTEISRANQAHRSATRRADRADLKAAQAGFEALGPRPVTEGRRRQNLSLAHA